MRRPSRPARATAVMALECAAMLPPSFLEYAVRMGASAVVVAGCKEGDCEFRLGDQRVRERILGLREPRLRASAPRERIAVVWSGRDAHLVRETLGNLRERVSALKGAEANTDWKEIEHE